MGTSHIDYGDRGFWTRDSALELWLYLACAAIDNDSEAPMWLCEAREHWYQQATVGFMGCVSVELDEHLTGDAAREAQFVALVELVRSRIAGYGLAIPAEVASSFGTGGGLFTQDVNTDVLLRLGDALAGLVRGEVKWDPTPPPGVWP